MSEPTSTSRIISGLEEMQEALGELIERVRNAAEFSESGLLLTNLLLNGFKILGGLNDDGSPRPAEIEAAIIRLMATDHSEVQRARFPYLDYVILESAVTLNDTHNGRFLWYSGTSTANLSLPTDPEIDYWFTAKCAPGSSNAVLVLPSGGTIDGTPANQELIVSGERKTVTLVHRGSNAWWSI